MATKSFRDPHPEQVFHIAFVGLFHCGLSVPKDSCGYRVSCPENGKIICNHW